MARILIHKRGSLLDFLEGVLAGQDVVEADGKQKEQNFDLVVIDTQSLGPDLGDAVESAKRAVDADKPVLLFRPNSAHKAALAAAGVLRTYPTVESIALFIAPYHDNNGRLRVRLAEQFAPNQFGGRLTRVLAGNTSRGPADPVVDTFVVPPGGLPTITEMAPFLKRVRRVVGGGDFLAADDASPNNPPSNVPSGLYDVTPYVLNYPMTATGNTQSVYTPPSGSLSLEALVTIGIYYDNTSFNQAAQWLLIEHSGLFYTAGLEATTPTAVGWSIGELQITGSSISSSTIVTKQSSPNNVNNQTTYSSDTSFGVGLSAGTDGISANVSYTIGSSVSQSISDWQIVQSAPNVWQFAQATPYNGATPPGVFPDGCFGSNGIATLPPISAGSLAFDAQTVWIQLPASQTNGAISFTYYTQSWFVEGSSGKAWQAYVWVFYLTAVNNWVIDWSAAWPTGS